MYGIVFYGGVILVISWITRKMLMRHRLPLPPGPKGLPIVGNILDLPPPSDTPEWQHWLKHKDLYGPISSVTVLNQTIVLVHDLEMAFEILSKRSATFSSRPFQFFFHKMCGYECSLSVQSNTDPRHRQQRKLIAQLIGSKSLVTKCYSSIDSEVQRFLLRIMSNSEDILNELQMLTGSLMLNILYGYNCQPEEDPMVALVTRCTADINNAGSAGAWLVDFIPWLRYLPEWMPGMECKRIGRTYRKNYLDAVQKPFEFTAGQRALSLGKPSYVSRLLGSSDAEDAIKYSANALYAGGTDTTVAAISWFFLAMTLFPDVQINAQEEIDRVMGSKIPGFQDRPNLPYVEAVIKETLRWMPIAPLGVAHTSDKENEFLGYRIPKGSMILPSIKWFSQNPDIYPEPHLFKPERFLGANQNLDPYTFCFGFGRRACPGQHFADATLFSTISRCLAALQIRKPVDSKTGREVDPVISPAPGLVSHPKNLRCRITPRSEKHKELIERIDTENFP